MYKISIVGAGDVGATIAYTLQISGLATEIVLLDVNRMVAAGHALDMSHGLFFTPTSVIRAGDPADCSGSRIVIITAGARQREGETRPELTRRNGEICDGIMAQLDPFLGQAVVLMVSNPVDIMTFRAGVSSRLPPERVLGSGTVLDSARFRFELSRMCGVDPHNVHAYVVGEHGDSEVFLWSRVNIAGNPLEAFCRSCRRGCTPKEKQAVERTVRESAYHIIEAKGYTNYGVALAVSRIAAAVLRDEKSVFTVSTRLQGEYGLEEICLSVPCVVGANGVERIVETDLSPDEAQGLARSAEAIRSSMT